MKGVRKENQIYHLQMFNMNKHKSNEIKHKYNYLIIAMLR